jgi:hypothetical protein
MPCSPASGESLRNSTGREELSPSPHPADAIASAASELLALECDVRGPAVDDDTREHVLTVLSRATAALAFDENLSAELAVLVETIEHTRELSTVYLLVELRRLRPLLLEAGRNLEATNGRTKAE